jgi:hypothetical protein
MKQSSDAVSKSPQQSRPGTQGLRDRAHVYFIMKLALFLLAATAFAQTAVIKTNPAPSWGPIQSWKVGATNGLDGSASTGGWSGYNWSCTAYDPGTGPVSCSSLTFNSTTVAMPTVTGAAFGDYTIQLCDGANMHCGTAHIGAVNFDANGVVIPRSANFTSIFGPTIALGQNPWGFADERNLAAMNQRATVYNTPFPYSSYTDANPDWANPQTGTVAYQFMGIGSSQGTTGTTLAAGINSTDTTITVADATKLDLSSLPGTPTRIMIQASIAGDVFGPYEEIRICGASGNTLTVCYDGRSPAGSGSFWNNLGFTNYAAAQSWSMGAVVGQQLIKGTGTSFLSTIGLAAAACPGGPVSYSTGTAGLTASSATMTGSGTAWMANVVAGDAVCVLGTHGSTPFKFVAWVTSVNSDTSLTLNRNFPSTGDTNTGLTYKVIKPFYRYIVTGFNRQSPYSGTGNLQWATTGCESDTTCFYDNGLNLSGYDIAPLNGIGTLTGTYAWADQGPLNGYLNQSSLGGINFYGESLAWISLYERSGLIQAKNMADHVANNWLKFPVFAGGYRQAYSPLFLGGGVIGEVAHYVLYGTPSINDLRPWFANGSIGSAGCSAYDTRDSGYLGTWLILGAIYDPDTISMGAPGGIPWRTYWRNAIGPGANTLYNRDVACAGSGGGVFTNSWANGLLWSAQTQVTMTNGSSALTGSGLTSGMCSGLDSGTATVMTGSNAITATSGTFSSTAGIIWLGGRHYQFLRTDSTHGQISVLWPGSSGSVSYMTETPILTNDSAPYSATYGQSNNDTALQNNYGCIFNNSSSITLDRSFTGTSGTNWQFNYINGISGFGQQPFMLGIKTYGMKLAAVLDSPLGTTYTALSSAAGAWMHTYGFNYENNSIFYGRVYGACESGGSQAGISQTFIWRIPGCGFGSNPPTVNFQVEGEQLNQEGFSAITKWYQDNPTPANLATVDTLYRAIWSKAGWNAPGFADDPNSIGNNIGASNLTDAQLAMGKYPGQLFGMGFAASWPAIRVTSPPSNAGTTISGSVSISGSAKIQ